MKTTDTDALKKGIPTERYREIIKKQNQSLYSRGEALKAVKAVIEGKLAGPSLNIVLDIFVDKLIKAVKDHVVAEIMDENWRVS